MRISRDLRTSKIIWKHLAEIGEHIEIISQNLKKYSRSKENLAEIKEHLKNIKQNYKNPLSFENVTKHQEYIYGESCRTLKKLAEF